jgi:hypothetical protein
VKTYGQLKLTLIQRGIYIPNDLRAVEEISCGLIRERNRLEIVLALSNDFIVRTEVFADAKDRAQLRLENDALHITIEDEDAETAVLPVPLFLRKNRETASPASQNVSLDGYCLNFFLRTAGPSQQLNLLQQDVLAVIQSAFEEGVADLVQFNMDYCQDENLCLDRLAPLIDSIKKKFSTFVSLRGFPPKSRQIIDKFYACGVDLLNYPLEGFASKEAIATLFPEDQILKGLEYAVEIFPKGAVSTELDFVAANEELLLRNIDRLTQAGIIPVLRLSKQTSPLPYPYDTLVRVLQHLSQAVQRHKLNLKWLYPTGHSATPLDSRYFTDSPSDARLLVTPVYQSKFGKRASEGFTALRRKLRVKNISDSYESAGL